MAAGRRILVFSVIAGVIMSTAVAGWRSYFTFHDQEMPLLSRKAPDIAARLQRLQGSDGTSGDQRLPGLAEEAEVDVAGLRAAVSNRQRAAGATPSDGEGGTQAVPPLRRVCGSPAVDGYAHVDPKCILGSPTAVAWRALHPQGGKSGEGLDCHMEESVSIDGLAVGWGIGNKKDTPEQCCQACRDHVPGPHVGGPFQDLPCNAWVFCPADVCFEADAHRHTRGDCWLKFTEAPQSAEINARGTFGAEFRARHPTAPERCPWVSGVLVPPGQIWTNGTWGPRASW